MTTPTSAPAPDGPRRLWLAHCRASAGQDLGRLPGPGTGVRRIVARGGDVPQLAPRAGRLAVEVDVDAGDGEGLGQRQSGIEAGPAEDVDRGHRRRRERGVSQGPVEDGPQVVLELGGDAALDGEVPRVVGPGGQLVDQQAPPGDEQLHGQDAGHATGLCDRQAQVAGLAGQGRGEGGRGQQLVADSVPLHRLHHGVDPRFARGAPGHQDGHLALDGHPLLGQQFDAPRRRLPHQGSGALGSGTTHTPRPS